MAVVTMWDSLASTLQDIISGKKKIRSRRRRNQLHYLAKKFSEEASVLTDYQEECLIFSELIVKLIRGHSRYKRAVKAVLLLNIHSLRELCSIRFTASSKNAQFYEDIECMLRPEGLRLNMTTDEIENYLGKPPELPRMSINAQTAWNELVKEMYFHDCGRIVERCDSLESLVTTDLQRILNPGGIGKTVLMKIARALAERNLHYGMTKEDLNRVYPE